MDVVDEWVLSGSTLWLIQLALDTAHLGEVGGGGGNSKYKETRWPVGAIFS